MKATTATEKRRQQATDPKAVYTTGQVATLCRVAPRTVSKWMDRGQLGGYRIPSVTGEGDRRIPRDELIRFMKSLKIPLGELATADTFAVLTVCPPPVFTDGLAKYLPAYAGYTVTAVPRTIDAGFVVGAGGIDAVVIGFADGRGLAVQLAARCREYGVRLVVGMVGYDVDTTDVITGFDMLVRQYSHPREVADRTAVAFDAKKEG